MRPCSPKKVATAIALGLANTRVRDYADIYVLTGSHVIAARTAREALLATAAYRGIAIEKLSDAVGNIVDLRHQTFDAYRMNLGSVGLHLPTSFGDVVTTVTAFADPLARDARDAIWQPAHRQWLAT